METNDRQNLEERRSQPHFPCILDSRLHSFPLPDSHPFPCRRQAQLHINGLCECGASLIIFGRVPVVWWTGRCQMCIIWARDQCMLQCWAPQQCASLVCMCLMWGVCVWSLVLGCARGDPDLAAPSPNDPLPPLSGAQCGMAIVYQPRPGHHHSWPRTIPSPQFVRTVRNILDRWLGQLTAS